MKSTRNTQSLTPNSSNRWWMIGSLVILIALGTGLLFALNSRTEIAYVNSNRVFAEFMLSKELKGKLDQTNEARKQVLDELDRKIKGLASVLEQNSQKTTVRDSLEQLVQTVAYKQEEYTLDNEQQATKYNEQIWTQLNQYLQDYCDEQGLDALLGADGSGSLLAGDKTLDRTDVVIQYINQRYLGN